MIRFSACAETPRPGATVPSFTPLFRCDWMRAVFLHYEVDAQALQSEVPFELDLWNGRAFVSLVAFTMQRLRPRFGGRVAELFFKPVASTRFLNVRTYVRHRNETGIFFIAEFVSNRLCVPLGPRTFGLPYRFGQLDYRHDHESGVAEGSVKAAGGRVRLTYRAMPDSSAGFQASRQGTLDFFLLERYAAFTCCGAKRRFFRVWHQPWLQIRVQTVVQDERLLATTGQWIKHACLVGANYSGGVRDVRMGAPLRIRTPQPRRRLTVFFDE
jgi:uncharacterized protein YqjF (DUF2071 family)